LQINARAEGRKKGKQPDKKRRKENAESKRQNRRSVISD